MSDVVGVKVKVHLVFVYSCTDVWVRSIIVVSSYSFYVSYR